MMIYSVYYVTDVKSADLINTPKKDQLSKCLKVHLKVLKMTCGDGYQCSNSKVPRKITKQEQIEQGPLKKIEVRSKAMEE